VEERETSLPPRPHVSLKRLLALSFLLALLWLVWALVRPRLSLSPEASELWSTGARLLLWVVPAGVYLMVSYGRRWSEPLGFGFPYGRPQVARAITLPLLLGGFLVVGTAANLGKTPALVLGELYGGLSPRLTAPVLEELVFRGVITSEALTWARETAPNFRSLIARFWAALFLTSGLFTLLHGPSLLASYGTEALLSPSLSLLVTGVVLGFLFAQTRSIYGCIFVHFLNNELSLL